jgi:WD40 repeat protein
MPHIFISYSRKDIDFAGKIVKALAENDLDTWIDWKSIPKGEDWEQEIYRGVQEADAFLFLISPDSVMSQMCNREIAHAVKNGKRILPIFISNVDDKEVHNVIDKFFQKEQKEEISRRNFIFCREGRDDFDNAIKETQKTIHTDFEWLKYHNLLQNKALAWDRAQKDDSRLLRGKELQEAEQQLANVGSQKDPQPTTLQRQYLLKSRQYADYMRRTITWSAIGVAVIMILLSLFAWGQRNTAIENQKLAEERAKIARANELAAQSVSIRDENFAVALLLGVDAFRTVDTVQTENALLGNTQAHPYLRTFLNQHTARINTIAVSPDGRILASGDTDHNITLWDLSTGLLLGSLPTKHTGEITSLAFSSNSKILASGSADKSIILWNVVTHEPIGAPLIKHDFTITTLFFDPHSTKLLSSAVDGTILWDLSADKPEPSPINARVASGIKLAISPGGKILAFSLLDNSIVLWDIYNNKAIGVPLTGPTNVILNLTFSPDGRWLASSGIENTIYLWEVGDKEIPTRHLIGDGAAITRLAFSPDSKLLAAANTNLNKSYITFWSMENYQPVGSPLTGLSGFITSMEFEPIENELVSGNVDGTIALWDINIDKQEKNSTSNRQFFPKTSVVFGLGGSILISGNAENVTFWNVNEQSIKESEVMDVSSYSPLITTRDGKVLIVRTGNGVSFWDTALRKPIGKLLQGNTPDNIRSIALSSDEKILATLNDGGILFWNFESGEIIQRLTKSDTRYSERIAFNSDGKLLAVGNIGSVELWDVATGSLLIKEKYDDTELGIIECLAFSPDGQFLVTGGSDGTIILWDVTNNQLSKKQVLKAQLSEIQDVGFSLDSKYFASGSGDHSVILWDTQTGHRIGEKFIGTDKLIVNSVTFSPDGKLLATAYQGGEIRLWNLSPISWIEKSCERAGRNLTRAEWSQYFPKEQYRKICEQWSLEPEFTLTATSTP